MNTRLLIIRFNEKPFKFLSGAVFGVFLIFFCAVFSVHGTTDLLLIPSEKSALARFSWLMDVAKADGRLVAVGERGHILYSDNNGEDWLQADVPVSVTLTAVYFPSAKKGWAVGHDSVVLHTEDGGKTWQKQIDGWKINDLMLAKTQEMVEEKEDALKKAKEKENREKTDILNQELDDLVYLVKDTEFVLKEGASRPLMDVWFRNDQEGIAIGTFGMILKTDDGGASWVAMIDRIENPYSNHLYSITRCGGSLYIAGEFGLLFRSDDFGNHWIALESPYEGSFFGIVGNPDTDTVIAFGLRGKIFYSQNKGETWIPASNPSEGALVGGTLLCDGSFLLVGSETTILEKR